MTRRSYLRRVAAPLTSGIPVLFATPQPLPDEARPSAITLAATVPTSSRGDGPTMRRAAVPATASNMNAAATPPLAAPMPERAPLDAAAVTPAEPAAGALPVVRRARPAASPATLTPRARDAAMQPLSTPSPKISPPPEPGAPSATYTLAAPLDLAPAPLGPTAPSVLPIFDADAAQSAPSSPQAPTGTSPTASHRALEPLTLPSAATPRPSESAPPRIHIGTIEVRTSAPPPAPLPPPQPIAAAPTQAPTTATPIARGYGWRFGLSQA